MEEYYILSAVLMQELFENGLFDLEEIAEIVGTDARADKEKAQAKNLEWWLAPIAAIGTGVGGAYLGAGIANGDVFGKLSGLNKATEKSQEELIKDCKYAADKAGAETGNTFSWTDVAIRNAEAAGVDDSFIEKVKAEKKTYNEAYDTYEGCKNSTEADCADHKTAPERLSLNNALKELGEACDFVDVAKEEKDSAKKTQTAAGVTGAVTAVAGGVMTFFATKAIKNAILDKAEQEAYDTFMNEIGNHIYCYIGGEEAGQYGDVITTSME